MCETMVTAFTINFNRQFTKKHISMRRKFVEEIDGLHKIGLIYFPHEAVTAGKLMITLKR